MTPWQHLQRATKRVADRCKAMVDERLARQIDADVVAYCGRSDPGAAVAEREYRSLKHKWQRMVDQADGNPSCEPHR